MDYKTCAASRQVKNLPYAAVRTTNISTSIRRPFDCLLKVIKVTDIIRLSVAYIEPKSRTERPRKTKIGTEVAHVTRDSDTAFKVKRSKFNLQGRAYFGGLPHSLFYYLKVRQQPWLSAKSLDFRPVNPQ